MPSRSRATGMSAILFVVAAALLVSCSGEKPPIHILNIALPNFCDDTPTTTVPVLVSGQMQESLRFGKSKKATVAQQYSEWFHKNGWTPMTGTQDVDSLEEIFTKDKVQVTMTYSAGRGLTFFATRPEADYKSAAAPTK